MVGVLPFPHLKCQDMVTRIPAHRSQVKNIPAENDM